MERRLQIIFIMKFIKVTLFLLSFNSAHSAVMCSDLLKNSDGKGTINDSETAPLSPFSLSNAARSEQENFDPSSVSEIVQNNSKDINSALDYFHQNLSLGLLNSSKWKSDFLSQVDIANEALDQITRYGRKFYRKNYTPQGYKDFFALINRFSFDEINSLPISKRISLLKTFSRWNLLPSSDFSTHLFKSLEQDISKWSGDDFFTFGLVRKISPLTPPDSFLDTYKKEVLKKFPDFQPKIAIMVLSGEFFQRTTFETNQMDHLLISSASKIKGLNDSERGTVASIKDFYRGLLYLKKIDNNFYAAQVSFLVKTIKAKLKDLNSSLDNNTVINGKNSSENEGIETAKQLSYIKSIIQKHFGLTESEKEYSRSYQPGFFDPVDEVYFDIKIVVEADGQHHYFKVIDENGVIIDEYEALVLRPIDQLKDATLKLSGFSVVRLVEQRSGLITSENFLDIISN